MFRFCLNSLFLKIVPIWCIVCLIRFVIQGEFTLLTFLVSCGACVSATNENLSFHSDHMSLGSWIVDVKFTKHAAKSDLKALTL